ncbi:MAG: aminoacetone oxidase family FAD-binding enzyme [Clostridiales bacterium]|jgi:predicted Rossmann fold flavoprotein|nr:aminoacetone oxidase family FAD-binding enzyme [Clostridiales bacterium]
MGTRKTVGIIGGGAAGLFAAALLSECRNADVTVLERGSRVGKKILVAGNGRCNLSHANTTEDAYDRPWFAAEVLSHFGVADTIAAFRRMGLELYEEEGRLYPYSESGATVLEVLRAHIFDVVPEVVNYNAVDIHKNKDGTFTVRSETGDARTFDFVILACGNKAGVQDYNAFRLAYQCGLGIVEPRPVLVPLRTCNNIKVLTGLRARARVSLVVEDKVVETREGEVQFRDGALSGIVVFELSHTLAKNYPEIRQTSLEMDFFKERTEEELVDMLASRLASDSLLSARFHAGNDPRDVLAGWFHRKLADFLVKDATSVGEIVKRIKQSRFIITDTLGFADAQAAAGGVSLNNVDAESCETDVAGLYCTGEMLDVSGTCGGYNLQWAWSTAALAARDIKRQLGEQD